MSRSLFISKNPNELEAFQQFCDSHHFTLTARSFLTFEDAPFTITKDFDVIFFSSPRSVMFFISKHTLSKKVKIACTGSKTKAIVESLGYMVDFHGETSNPQETAQKFKEWLGSRHVLFPLSDRSKKTISNLIPESQKEEVTAYTTKTIHFHVSPKDIYVFSSPSNVEAFFNSGNTIEDGKVIAWGSTTEKALEEQGVKSVLLRESSLEELTRILEEL